jgi:acyl-CoA synthetase (AMP-forming)/AMP-acid ligase II
MLWHDVLHHQIETQPDKIAQQWIGDESKIPEVVTFAMLDRYIRQAAAVLLNSGIKAGDRVALLLQNPRSWPIFT